MRFVLARDGEELLVLCVSVRATSVAMVAVVVINLIFTNKGLVILFFISNSGTIGIIHSMVHNTSSLYLGCKLAFYLPNVRSIADLHNY